MIGIVSNAVTTEFIKDDKKPKPVADPGQQAKVDTGLSAPKVVAAAPQGRATGVTVLPKKPDIARRDSTLEYDEDGIANFAASDSEYERGRKIYNLC